MRPGLYIVDERGNPVPEPDLLKWGKWMEGGERRVGLDVVGPSKVSTVFLGIDHGFSRTDGRPVLWETMVFGGDLDEECDRCSGNREQAEAMHREMIERVRLRAETALQATGGERPQS